MLACHAGDPGSIPGRCIFESFGTMGAHSALYIIVKFVIRFIAKLVQYTLNGEANSAALLRFPVTSSTLKSFF